MPCDQQKSTQNHHVSPVIADSWEKGIKVIIRSRHCTTVPYSNVLQSGAGKYSNVLQSGAGKYSNVLAQCSSRPIPVLPFVHRALHRVLQLTLVPSVFGESFFDNDFLHNPVSILHPCTILNGFHTSFIIQKPVLSNPIIDPAYSYSQRPNVQLLIRT